MSDHEGELAAKDALLNSAPILSKYHGVNGFELERFIADYTAWRTASRALEPRQAGKGEG